MKKTPKQNSQGFTMIESLVAISILVGAIIGTSGAVQTGISSYIYSKDQIVAFYLAQEGIEQIRNIRDENGLAGSLWLSGIAQNSSDPCYFGNTCIVDVTVANTLTRCAGACPVLRQDPTAGFYGHNMAWGATQFTREITLTSVSVDEVSILVEVSWSKGIVAREFRARENILNWQ